MCASDEWPIANPAPAQSSTKTEESRYIPKRFVRERENRVDICKRPRCIFFFISYEKSGNMQFIGDLSSSGISHSVQWQIGTDVSGQSIGNILKGQAKTLEDGTNRLSRNVGSEFSLYTA
jgi:hypothetical protein